MVYNLLGSAFLFLLKEVPAEFLYIFSDARPTLYCFPRWLYQFSLFIMRVRYVLLRSADNQWAGLVYIHFVLVCLLLLGCKHPFKYLDINPLFEISF